MTDQTESASDDYPICEDECVTWGGHAENCRVPAALRALEAKVREVTTERDHLRQHHDGHMPDCGGWDPAANMCGCGYLQGEAYRELRAERDRLAGEVERLKARHEHARKFDSLDVAQAEVARLTAELAAARENEARWMWMFPDDALVSVTERMQRVYRKWDGSDSWNAVVDAARRAGGAEQ